jgi:hypothetical protein
MKKFSKKDYQQFQKTMNETLFKNDEKPLTMREVKILLGAVQLLSFCKDEGGLAEGEIPDIEVNIPE